MPVLGLGPLKLPKRKKTRMVPFQPRSQHSRVGMLRQNNQHTPARAAVLAAVLRHTASLSAVFFIIKMI